jgi:hypothetical protein
MVSLGGAYPAPGETTLKLAKIAPPDGLVVTLLVCLLLAGLPFQMATSAGGIQVLTDDVVLGLPPGLTFQLSAQSDDEISSVVLHYGTNAEGCQARLGKQSLEFDADQKVTLEWQWEFRRSGILPQGAELWWQWEIGTSAGETLMTERRTILIEDQRHTWKKSDQEQVTLQWYQGSSSFGSGLHSLAVNSLRKITRDTGIEFEGSVWITIYPTAEEIQEVMVRTTEWTGGAAFVEYNIIIIAIGPGEDAWAKSVIPHELAHLVVNRATYNCRGASISTWLSEGLAVYAEGPVSEFDRLQVEDALQAGSLPRLSSLARGFSAYSGAANLSYAQSAVVVDYLLQEYGPEEMGKLLAAVRDGKTMDEALLQVYQRDTDGLDAAWRDSLGYASLPSEPASATGESIATSIPTLALWTALVRSSATPVPTDTPSPQPSQTFTPLPSATSTQPPATPVAAPAAQTPAGSSGLPLLLGGGVVLLIVAAFVVWKLKTRPEKRIN